MNLRATLATLALTATVVLGLTACAATEAAPGLRASSDSDPSPVTAELSIEDGRLPDGDPVSPFDVDLPAIARLDPALLAATQAAATEAKSDGVEMVVTSGWRSARFQQSLVDDAVQKYGSSEEAARWVKSPEESSHVSGKAVDIGYTDAASWMMQHGPDYGLCQTYTNEMWHFELATEPGGTCPEQQTDAAG
ncbi:M15 family metallopeptidase [Cellulomonas taurus]|uniref:M15 family metallopeptidase n=1 Tax=Cellulomonas taurus TaxID=2729175 RepID=UPI00145E4CB0|nr:M15 family metallopeptidase [Cellulomonas taurus]